MRFPIMIAAALLTLTQLASPAFGQAANGRGECLPRVEVSYYKTPPGRQDEWLALYMKWHHPIMEYQIKHGVTISSTLYAAGNHAPGMPWDFAIITVNPAKGAVKPLGLTRPQLIRKLYPNQKEYIAGEKARWALTIDHWDEPFVQMSWDEPMSLYAPIDGGCKK